MGIDRKGKSTEIMSQMRKLLWDFRRWHRIWQKHTSTQSFNYHLKKSLLNQISNSKASFSAFIRFKRRPQAERKFSLFSHDFWDFIIEVKCLRFNSIFMIHSVLFPKTLLQLKSIENWQKTSVNLQNMEKYFGRKWRKHIEMWEIPWRRNIFTIFQLLHTRASSQQWKH